MMTSSAIPADAAALLDEWLGEGWSAQALSGDASVRAYYRVTTPDGNRFVMAWYPVEVRTQVDRFVHAYDAVSPYAPVPTVVGYAAAGVLQADVGDRTLLQVLEEDGRAGAALYRSAVDLLIDFQQAEADVNPPFTAEFFRNELAMAEEYFVGRLAGSGAGEPLGRLLDALADKVSHHPYVLCHRDYHGQNVHLFDDSLFIIDYQDLREGPDTYDLASLLRDRGVADLIGEPLELDLIGHYARRRGLPPREVRQRYFETLLQRSVKILGTFARLPIERGRMHYLDYIPATLRSVARCAAELPEFAPIAEFFPQEFALDRARRRARELNESLSA